MYRSLHPQRTDFWRLCLCASLLFFCQSVFSQTDKSKEEELQELRATIERLQRELKTARSTRDELSEELEKTEKEIGTLNKKAREIRRELRKSKSDLDSLRDERSQLERDKKGQQQLVGDYVNAAYRLGQEGHLRLLLNQEDPSQVARSLKYYDYFAKARGEKIQAFLATIERLNAIEPEIAAATARIRESYNELEQQQKALNSAQGERKSLISKLSNDIQNQDQELRARREDRRQLERLLSQMIENIADIPVQQDATQFANLKGKLPWPAEGRVVKRFGSQRVANRMNWEGVLISSSPGDEVKAVHYGRVIFSDYLRGHGLLIIVDHGMGYMSLYAHNQALFKELGEWVESGEVIASVGNSGGMTEAALYFELRYQGKPTNPQPWLRRA